MRALIQRVSRASVSVGGEAVSSIDRGLAVLVGVGKSDTEDDARYLADKIANLRIFSAEAGKFNLSVLDTSGSLLIISQFTLYASTRKGRRPGFTEAALPEIAEDLINRLAQHLVAEGLDVKTGRFQQHMLVEIHNDGPVTIFIDSAERFQPRNN